MHVASRLGNVDIVMLLLQHGAEVDTATKDMYTALHIAAKEGQEEVTYNNKEIKKITDYINSKNSVNVFLIRYKEYLI